MTTFRAAIGTVLLLVSAALNGVSWLATPYSYPWEDGPLGTQLDDDAVSAILLLSAVSVLACVAAYCFFFVRPQHRRFAPNFLRPLHLLALALILFCTVMSAQRFWEVSRLPNPHPYQGGK